MPQLSDIFKDEIASAVASKLNSLGQQAQPPFEVTSLEVAKLLTVPPQFDLGQAALPCFPFAKALKQPPPKIALELAESFLENTRAQKTVAKIDAVNGYLNFHADFKVYGGAVTREIRDGAFFTKKLLLSEELEKVVIEYSQPNTHKALHVGHLRCLVLGDAVCNVLAYVGHDVVRATYPGDMGAHIAKTLWYLAFRFNGQWPEADASKRADWLGEIYARADEAIKTDTGTPAEQTNRAQIAEILKELQCKSGAHYELWLKTREWSFDQMRGVYAWLGVNFDVWYTESECDAPSRKLVKKKYEEGFFVQSEGAVGLDLTSYKLGFAMFLKSDGNGLYITKDLELLRRKFADYSATKSLVVVDYRQKLHFGQLYKTAELMGYPQAAKSGVLLYETVNSAKGEAFSSRQLNGLKLSDLREQMQQKVTRDYLERYRGDWTDAEIQKTAEIVTIGALKYGMLKVDNTTQIIFVLEEWLRLDGDTGPYLQYVHARCCNILEKQGRPSPGFDPATQFELAEQIERELSFWLARFNEFAVAASAQMRPSMIAGYLYDLAKNFNRFYEACPIRSSTGALRDSRLALVEATALVMSQGLGLLGIPAPRRM